MEWDRTQTQSDTERQRSRDLSQPDRRPPAQIPGIEFVQFLGEGAYGEVWIALDGNTGRRVAVKFFANRRNVDWAGIAGEVEKLVLLSNDRRIVQLLKVGWDATPPYYVMEYLEHGSLEARLRADGPWSCARTIELFRELAKALRHAHAKGVLHCDLKPANVLLDHDFRPRLCDFGQSRLTSERRPALGTFFYMAPEQAALDATPDVRWDVYGLGAILYRCLTGHPPYASPAAEEYVREGATLTERLERYRGWIEQQGSLTISPGQLKIDRRLATILERCLARQPERRFGNIQEVLDALEGRDLEYRRRPLLILGGIAPLLLVIIMALFAWRGMTGAVEMADRALTAKVRKSNEFAAQFVAARVAADVERYYQAVEQRAKDPELVSALKEASRAWQSTADYAAEPERIQAYLQQAGRAPLQQLVQSWLQAGSLPQVASWFVCGADGTQLAAEFDRKTAPTLGKNFAWRTYFHGGPADVPPGSPVTHHLSHTQLSALLKSTATQTWKVAVSTPVRDPDTGAFLGVVAVTFEIGRFLAFFESENAAESRFAVLVDGRRGPFRGVILQHPLYTRLIRERGRLPDEFSQLRVDLDSLDLAHDRFYRDPLAKHPTGEAFQNDWIAARADVRLPSPDDGNAGDADGQLVVIVQEDHDTAVAPVADLEQDMRREGLTALALICITVVMAWYLVLRRIAEIGLPVHGWWGRREATTTS